MATRFSSVLFADASNAGHIQGWAGFVEDTLVTTGGWVVTADTGQTLPSALTAAAASNTKKGYRIYRMDDTLQSTAPIFMRIDYGSGNGTAQAVGMWITIGTGSDGAGNITNIRWNGGASAIANVRAGGSTTQANNCYGSADTNRFSLMMFVNTVVATLALVFSLERTKDDAGADTDEGLLLVYSTQVSGSGSTADTSRFIIMAGGTQPTAETGLNYALTSNNPTDSLGGDIGTGIVMHFKGVVQQPGIGVVIVNNLDVSAEGSFQISLYGNTITYQAGQATPFGYKALVASAAADTSTRACVRYD